MVKIREKTREILFDTENFNIDFEETEGARLLDVIEETVEVMRQMYIRGGEGFDDKTYDMAEEQIYKLAGLYLCIRVGNCEDVEEHIIKNAAEDIGADVINTGSKNILKAAAKGMCYGMMAQKSIDEKKPV